MVSMLVKSGAVINLSLVALGAAMTSVVAVLLWMSIVKTPEQRFTAHWKAANSALKDNRINKAENEFRKALDDATEAKNLILSAMANESLADLAISKNDLVEAERLLVATTDGYKKDLSSNSDASFELKEQATKANYKLATVLHREKKYPQAETAIKAALVLNEDVSSAELQDNLQKEYSQLLRDSGRTHEAEEFDARVAESTSRRPELYMYSGVNYYRRGKLDLAIERLNSAVAISERMNRYKSAAGSQVYIATILFQQHKFAEAYEFARKILNNAYSSSNAAAARCLTVQACCLRVQGKVKESNQLLETSLQVDSHSTWWTLSELVRYPHPKETDEVLAGVLKDNQDKIKVDLDPRNSLEVFAKRLDNWGDNEGARVSRKLLQTAK